MLAPFSSSLPVTTPSMVTSLWPSIGDRKPAPWMSWIFVIVGGAWTTTDSVHVPVCGVASLFAARTTTLYVPAGTASLTVTVPVAVPPVPGAGETLPTAIDPALGDGVTDWMSSCVTV